MVQIITSHQHLPASSEKKIISFPLVWLSPYHTIHPLAIATPPSSHTLLARTRVPEPRAKGISTPALSTLRFPSALAGDDGEMGKNQAYKAMQRSWVGSSSGAPGAADAPEDGMVGPLPPPSHPPHPDHWFQLHCLVQGFTIHTDLMILAAPLGCW
jgi:hypothetical protein